VARAEAPEELKSSRRLVAPALLLALSLFASSASDAAGAPVLEPGVSRALAAWRAPRYRDVGYALELEVDRDATRLAGTVQIAVPPGSPVPDLVLDWRPPAGARLDELTVNGAPARGARTAREHLVVPAALLRAGRNTVRARIETPIAISGGALTRYEDRED